MIKGILFDKDGTLIDFFSLWLGAANTVVKHLLQESASRGYAGLHSESDGSRRRKN